MSVDTPKNSEIAPIFHSLLSFGTNSTCYCSKGPTAPTHAWVKHGIFLSTESAKEMESQPNMTIKSLASKEDWTDKEIQTLSYGGNSRLDEFLGPYLLSLEKDKYSWNVFNLKATEFYSKRLESFTNSSYFSEPPPSLKEGVKNIENSQLLDLDYPHPSGDNELEIFGSDEKPPSKAEEKGDFFDNLDENVKEIFETTGELVQEHASSFWDSTAGIRGKTKEAWEKSNQSSKEAIDKAGNFTKESWDKTKNFSKEAWGKTVNIFEKVGQNLKNMGDDKKEDTKEDKPTFKNFFGLFSSDKPKEEEKTQEPEQQFFSFENQEKVEKEENPEAKRKDSDDDDNIDHLFMLKEELKSIEEKQQDSLMSASSEKPTEKQEPLLDFQ